MTTRNDIEKVLWRACDTFRGKIDSSRYKDYILSMMFVKYLSDVYKETRANYMTRYDGDEARVERAMRRERFTLSETSTFDFLYENRNDNEIGVKSIRRWNRLRTTTVRNYTMFSAQLISTRKSISGK